MVGQGSVRTALISTILINIKGHDAGSASGVLTTVQQLFGAGKRGRLGVVIGSDWLSGRLPQQDQVSGLFEIAGLVRGQILRGEECYLVWSGNWNRFPPCELSNPLHVELAIMG